MNGHQVSRDHLILACSPWTPIPTEDILRIDYPPTEMPWQQSPLDPPRYVSAVQRKAIRIEMKDSRVRWSHGDRGWYAQQKQAAFDAARHNHAVASESLRRAGEELAAAGDG